MVMPATTRFLWPQRMYIFHDLIGKLGYGFTSADGLEEVDIGPGDKPRPTFISKKLDPSLREPMIALLREYRDCFTWIILKCLVWIEASLNIGSRLRKDFGRFNNEQGR